MASWIIDTNGIGKTVQHTDGTRGVVLSAGNGSATVDWEDGLISTEQEDYLTYV